MWAVTFYSPRSPAGPVTAWHTSVELCRGLAGFQGRQHLSDVKFTAHESKRPLCPASCAVSSAGDFCISEAHPSKAKSNARDGWRWVGETLFHVFLTRGGGIHKIHPICSAAQFIKPQQASFKGPRDHTVTKYSGSYPMSAVPGARCPTPGLQCGPPRSHPCAATGRATCGPAALQAGIRLRH